MLSRPAVVPLHGSISTLQSEEIESGTRRKRDGSRNIRLINKEEVMRKTLLVAAVIAFGICSAMADTCNGVSSNLVSNCGFETGDFTGWTIGGNTANPGGFYYGVDNFDAHSGNFGAYMSEDAIDGGTSPVSLSQTLTTGAGTSYLVSFWLEQDTAPDGTTVHSFDATWDGNAILDLTPTASNPGTVGSWTEYTFSEVATGSTSTLAFDFRNDDNYWSLDDVSAVPEPASCMLIGSALFGLLGLRRRIAK